jgi:DNA-binding beta-propeller fold protein YncE
MKAAVCLAIGSLIVSLTVCGPASADQVLGPFRVSATFHVGTGPLRDVTTDSVIHTASLTSGDDDSVYVANAAAVVSSMRVDRSPAGVAVDPATRTAYVTGEHAVSVVDIASRAIVATIPVATTRSGSRRIRTPEPSSSRTSATARSR